MTISIHQRFTQTRQYSTAICEPLVTEDFGLQAAAFASPPKWHLAHTSWFFETFILKLFNAEYHSPCDDYAILFNSYYNGIGEQFPRPQRGLLSRPTVAEVFAYRDHIDRHMLQLLEQDQHPHYAEILVRTRLGIEHEQQHQELFFTDLKYSLSINPLLPTYSPQPDNKQPAKHTTLQWREYAGGQVDIGASDNADFYFDNESPRHAVLLSPFALANRLVSNQEFLQFIEDGGYQRPELWLADGWSTVQEHNWQQPLYWQQKNQQWHEFSLHGLQPLDLHQPVCHISGYEADAYATWAGCRLPLETEWEYAASQQTVKQSSRDGHFQPMPTDDQAALSDLYDNCWQWTGSAYRPYPGFTTPEGAIGEYNGKFMCNQWVLRGGSCITSSGHCRASYRNFFYPQDRWQFSGIRLAKDL